MNSNWLSRIFKRLRSTPQVQSSEPPVASMDQETLKRMVRGIVTAFPDEIGCDECFQQVDRFAEMVLDGKDAAEVLPLVQDHLDRCGECHEEFEALMTALRSFAL